jgi:hypothetical protein
VDRDRAAADSATRDVLAARTKRDASQAALERAVRDRVPLGSRQSTTPPKPPKKRKR